MCRHASPIRAALACAVVVCAARPVAAQTIVATCGQAVAGAGVLAADLDCSAFAGPSAVVLTSSGSLDLAGFTLHGPLAGEAVRCDGDCTVGSSAPGGTLALTNGATGVTAVAAEVGRLAAALDLIRVEGFAVAVRAHQVALTGVTLAGNHVAVAALGSNNSPNRIVIESSLISNGGRVFGAGNVSKGRIRIRDSRFENNTLTGASLFNARSYRATIRDSQFVGNTAVGLLGSVKLTDTDILDSQVRGLVGSGNLRVRGGTVSGNGAAAGVAGFDIALGSDFLKVRDVEMIGNLTALAGDSIRARDTTIADSIVDGVTGRIVTITRSTVVDSGRYGIRARGEEEFFAPDRKGRAIVKASTVTGSGTFGVIVDGEPKAGDLETPDCVVAAGVTLSASDVTGNGTDAECGTTLACADLAACDATLVTAAMACDTSYRIESGLPGASLGVCALD